VKRILLASLLLLAVGCGDSSNITCNWTCDTSHGSKSYPAGSDAEAQCAADFGGDCAHFDCTCSS
jgi:hypothetical protein